MNNWDYIKLHSSCIAKDSIIPAEQKPQNEKYILTNYPSGRGLVSPMYKELKKLNIKETNNPTKNGV